MEILFTPLTWCPRLELVECAGATLRFKTLSGSVSQGKQQVMVHAGDEYFKTRVEVVSVGDGRCTGRWAEETQKLSALNESYRIERRVEDRLPCDLRVLSKELPGGSSWVKNIGGDGLQLMMCGPLEPGQKFELALETDENGILPVTLNGEVRWCSSTESGHLAGISLKSSRSHRLHALRTLAPRFERRTEPRQATVR